MTDKPDLHPLKSFSAAVSGLVAAVAPSLVSFHSHRSASSGSVWKSGWVVTADEALAEEGEIAVTFAGGKRVAAAVAGRDPTTDIGCLLLCQPRPMPTAEGIAGMPWRAPLGGLVGAFAVVAGLLFVDKVGAGAFAGLTITANILMSLLVDKYGWFGMEVHPLSMGRMAGAALMVGGTALISKF